MEKITSDIDLIDIKLTLYTLVGSVDVGKAGLAKTQAGEQGIGVLCLDVFPVT